MCHEIDRELLSLPLGDQTAAYFVQFIKGARSERLRDLCLRELAGLDERFDTGQVGEAARHLRIGSSSSSRQHNNNIQHQKQTLPHAQSKL